MEKELELIKPILYMRKKNTEEYLHLQEDGLLAPNFIKFTNLTSLFTNPTTLYANPKKTNSTARFELEISKKIYHISLTDQQADKIQQKKGSIFCIIDKKPYRIYPQEAKPIANIISIQNPVEFKVIKPILYMRQKNTEEYFHFSEDGTLALDSSIKFNNPTIFYTDPQTKENSIAYFKIEISKKTYYLPLTKEQVNEIKENKGSIFCTINQKEYRIYPQDAKKSILSYLANIGLIGFFVLLIIQTFNPLFIHKLCLHFY